MSEYPEDIMNAAAEAAQMCIVATLGRRPGEDMQDTIAAAILSERKRCAELARKWGETCRSIGQVIEADIAEDIAVTIEDVKQ